MNFRKTFEEYCLLNDKFNQAKEESLKFNTKNFNKYLSNQELVRLRDLKSEIYEYDYLFEGIEYQNLILNCYKNLDALNKGYKINVNIDNLGVSNREEDKDLQTQDYRYTITFKNSKNTIPFYSFIEKDEYSPLPMPKLVGAQNPHILINFKKNQNISKVFLPSYQISKNDELYEEKMAIKNGVWDTIKQVYIEEKDNKITNIKQEILRNEENIANINKYLILLQASLNKLNKNIFEEDLENSIEK